MAVLVLIPEQEDKEVADIDEIEWLRAAAANPAFEFLKEPEEDIYTLADGRPLCLLQRGSLMSNHFNKELRAFADDHTWVNDHLESLLDKYAEQWVAVKDRCVIASDVDLMLLREKLEDPANICIEFVTREPLEMLL